jgi:hypothetical protein
LAPPNGNIHNRAFPRHPGGQRLYLVERYLRVIAKAALRGPAHRAVLHAVSLKAVNVPVVHAHRDGHGENTLGILDHLARIVVEAQNVRRCIEVLQRKFIGVILLIVVSIVFPPWPDRTTARSTGSLPSIGIHAIGIHAIGIRAIGIRANQRILVLLVFRSRSVDRR